MPTVYYLVDSRGRYSIELITRRSKVQILPPQPRIPNFHGYLTGKARRNRLDSFG